MDLERQTIQPGQLDFTTLKAIVPDHGYNIINPALKPSQQAESGLWEQLRRQTEVPDPLEGVIEGDTRKERYDKFVAEVLGNIWPDSSASGEYGADLWRSTRSEKGDPSAYSHFSPLGRDPLALNDEEFEKLVRNIGTPDYVRLRLAPQQLVERRLRIMPVGGSCAVETWGMRSATELRALIQENNEILSFLQLVDDKQSNKFSDTDAAKLADSISKKITILKKRAKDKEILTERENRDLSVLSAKLEQYYAKQEGTSLLVENGLSTDTYSDYITEVTNTKNQYQNILADTARRIIAMAPTVTHASGAMLTGQDFGVHFVESDMWAARLEEWGIPHEEAQQITKDAYERINEIVARRAKLINPNATIINVNFDDLNLQENIAAWFEEMGRPYKRDHRVIEVIHTYVGPQQMEAAKNALRQRIKTDHLTSHEKQVAAALLKADYHIRLKQTDHNHWGSMNLPKEVILGMREMTTEEQQKYNEDYAYRMGIDVMSDVYQRNVRRKATAFAAGFADTPGPDNTVQHESRDVVGFKFRGIAGTPEFKQSLETSLTTPARLNRTNVDAHLQFLEAYIRPDAAERRQELIGYKKMLSEQLRPLEKTGQDLERQERQLQQKITQKEARIADEQNTLMVVNHLITPSNAEVTEPLKAKAQSLRERYYKQIQSIQAKKDDLNEYDKQDLDILPQLLHSLEDFEQGKHPVLSLAEQEYLENRLVSETQDTITYLQNEIKNPEQQEAGLKYQLVHKQEERTEFENVNKPIVEEIRLQLAAFDTEMKALGGSLFPLSDNPFVHHSMQFLWDPDFAQFLKNAVDIQNNMTAQRSEIQAKTQRLTSEYNVNSGQYNKLGISKNEEIKFKEQRTELEQQEKLIRNEAAEQMRNNMRTIYPKLKAYINYLYGRIEYPDEIRNSRLFA